MNQFIVHTVSDYSKDEERLKVLRHTPYLFKNFYGILEEIKSPEDGGFIFIKSEKYYSWNEGLYCACLGGHVNVVNLMIEKGANNWNWGFRYACGGGHPGLVNLMISKGANHWDKGLYSACHGGHLNLVNLMIEKGANDWNWGLRYACRRGHLNIVKLMIEKGATHCGNCGKSLEEHVQKSSQEP